MHKRIAFVVAVLSATIVAAASLAPLSIKTGAWQVTMTSSINGMPPHTTSYTSCVRPGDLTKYPFTDPKANCTAAPEYVGFRVVRGAAKPTSPTQ